MSTEHLLKGSAPSDVDTFLNGLWRQNPVFVLVLGMCPTMAITNAILNAFSMGIATTFVLVCSSTLVSIFRRQIPKQVRITAYIVIIATFVTITDYAIQAMSIKLYSALGAYVQLIVANCLTLGRAEAFAARNKPWKSALDALGMGLGFTFALLCLGVVREILGNGTIFSGTPFTIHLFGPHFEPWAVMLLPPGGFFVLAGWLLLFAWFRERKNASKESAQ